MIKRLMYLIHLANRPDVSMGNYDYLLFEEFNNIIINTHNIDITLGSNAQSDKTLKAIKRSKDDSSLLITKYTIQLSHKRYAVFRSYYDYKCFLKWYKVYKRELTLARDGRVVGLFDNKKKEEE